MSYLTDLAVAMRIEDFERLVKEAHEESVHPSAPDLDADYDEHGSPESVIEAGIRRVHRRGTDGDWVSLLWEGADWNDLRYGGVRFVSRFIRDLGEYQLVRFGEDPEDCEVVDLAPVSILGTSRRIVVLP